MKSSSSVEWKSAVDQKTGRTYYYNTKTRETTWSKPLALASPEEQQRMIEEKEATLRFFREMEANIFSKVDAATKREAQASSPSNFVSRGLRTDSSDSAASLSPPRGERVKFAPERDRERERDKGRDRESLGMLSKSRRNSLSGDAGGNGDAKLLYVDDADLLSAAGGNRSRLGSFSTSGRRVRTISTMDDEVLLSMSSVAREKSHMAMVSAASLHDAAASSSSSAAAPSSSSSLSISAASTAGNRLVRTVSISDAIPGSGSGSYAGSMDLRAGSKDERSDSPIPIKNLGLGSAAEAKDSNGISRRLARTEDRTFGNEAKSPTGSGSGNTTGAGTGNRLTTRRLIKRRNSTGTIYLGSTMSQQDNDATIHCVCVVIRAHMIEAKREKIVPKAEFAVFLDAEYRNSAGASVGSRDSGSSYSRGRDEKDGDGGVEQIPSLDTVRGFFMEIFSKSQLESDTIIMALIYCERLVKETRGRLCIRYDNWKSILFACLVMASKVWDDMSMWNVDFSQVMRTGFSLARVNELELAMLDALKYIIRVPASEYAKYYFHLRSMSARLGLKPADASSLKPLDISGARKLQLATEAYQNSSASSRMARATKRAKSIHVDLSKLTLERARTGSFNPNWQSAHQVALEELVHSVHMDADGQIHVKKKEKRRVLGAGIVRSSTAGASSSGAISAEVAYQRSLQAESKDSRK